MAYLPGDEILQSEPFAVAVLNEHLRKVCSWCLRGKAVEATLKDCGDCNTLRYCSMDCLRKDWKEGPHKVQCKYLKAAAGRDQPHHQTRLIARIIFKLKKRQGDKAEELPDQSRRTYNDLMTHRDKVVTDPRHQEDFQNCWQELRLFLGEESEEIYELALTAYCKMVINNDGITDEEGNTVAGGIGLLSSAFDHSCYPNAISVSVGRTAVIRAIDRIDSLTDVRISYWPEAATLPASTRRDLLEKSHYFICECDECNMVNPGSEEREAIRSRTIRCGTCTQKGMRNGCIQCKALGLPPFEVLVTLGQGGRVIELLTSRNLQKDYINNPNSPENPKLWSFNSLDKASKMAVKDGNLEKARMISKITLNQSKELYPKAHSFVAFRALELAKIENLMGREDLAEEYFQEARSIFLISHGPDHEWYRRETLDEWRDI